MKKRSSSKKIKENAKEIHAEISTCITTELWADDRGKVYMIERSPIECEKIKGAKK